MTLLNQLNPLNLIKRNPITKPEHFIYTQEWSETPNTKPETNLNNGLLVRDILKDHLFMIAFKNRNDNLTLPLSPIVVSRRQNYKANLIKKGTSQGVYTDSFIPLQKTKKTPKDINHDDVIHNGATLINYANHDAMIWYSERPAAIYARNILAECLSKFTYPNGQSVKDVTFEVISGYEALEALYGNIDNIIL